ncbi:MAG: hypothetical protein LBJ08_12405 [Bifidobacteriaceae bacterium]|jgi:hypothetical protein|nr:hypothetical protein [Bifidobacteriaceae bacterium]
MDEPNPLRITAVESEFGLNNVRLWRSDGKVANFNREFRFESHFASIALLPEMNMAVFVPQNGERFVVELPTVNDNAPLRGRPVVYLDQGIWSRIATALWRPEKLDDQEVVAARWLKELADRRLVVVPFSSGNLIETSHWRDTERRRQLVLCIAGMSRGWQMLDPLTMRANEMRNGLAQYYGKHPASHTPPWTLRPNASFDSVAEGTAVPDVGANPEVQLMFEAAASTHTFFDTLLAEESMQRLDSAVGWAEVWNEFCAVMRAGDRSQNKVEQGVRLRFLLDLIREL